MDNGKTILAGIDLCDDYTQVCCLFEQAAPQSVSLSKDPGKYRIPTVLMPVTEDEWLIGEEAQNFPADGMHHLIKNIIGNIDSKATYLIFGREYDGDAILRKFLDRLLTDVLNKTEADRISAIAVTLPKSEPELEPHILAAFEELGYPKENIRIISHLESFMYYVVSQNRDIWINDVGLFEFDTDRFVFYRLSFGRKNMPVTVVADKQDLSDSINYSMLESEDNDRLLYAFSNMTSLMLHKQMISALYFTGSGFESSWADESLKHLCNGRRIFRGQNLYVKGAGYAAGMIFNGGSGDYLFVNDEVLKSSISIRIFTDGGYEELELASIGDTCEKAAKEINIIMDGTNELDFIVHNVLKKDFICAIMTLETINLREDRTNRLNIRLRFPRRDTCVITVRDSGFGEIYPTNHKIWEQVLKI